MVHMELPVAEQAKDSAELTRGLGRDTRGTERLPRLDLILAISRSKSAM